jgi:hypothetical protein
MSKEKIMEEIKVGDKLPSLVLQEGIGEYKTVEVNIADLISKKRVVIFGVPGAFTPGCSKSHVPSFITAYDELLSKGIDIIICIATNDAYVMEVCIYYCVMIYLFCLSLTSYVLFTTLNYISIRFFHKLDNITISIPLQGMGTYVWWN